MALVEEQRHPLDVLRDEFIAEMYALMEDVHQSHALLCDKTGSGGVNMKNFRHVGIKRLNGIVKRFSRSFRAQLGSTDSTTFEMDFDFVSEVMDSSDKPFKSLASMSLRSIDGLVNALTSTFGMVHKNTQAGTDVNIVAFECSVFTAEMWQVLDNHVDATVLDVVLEPGTVKVVYVCPRLSNHSTYQIRRLRPDLFMPDTSTDGWMKGERHQQRRNCVRKWDATLAQKNAKRPAKQGMFARAYTQLCSL